MSIDNEELKSLLGPEKFELFEKAVDAFNKDWVENLGEDPGTGMCFDASYCMVSVWEENGDTHMHFNERAGGNYCGKVIITNELAEYPNEVWFEECEMGYSSMTGKVFPLSK